MHETTRHSNRFLFGFMLLFACISLAGSYYIPREAFVKLIAWQVLLHLLFFGIYRLRYAVSLTTLVTGAIVTRLLLVFLPPFLSEDIYRFIWDGSLAAQGVNPLLSTPDSFLDQLSIFSPKYDYYVQLHAQINHPQYHTCYPPLMQFACWIAAGIGRQSVYLSLVIIKIILALFDALGIVCLAAILKHLKKDPRLVVLYAWHPLVLIEGVGNGHFEVMQIAIVCTSLYFLLKNKWILSSILWGLAIATKLLPAMFLPAIILFIGWKKGIRFSCICLGVVVLSFLPFISQEAILAFTGSIRLFLQQFEFNASLYYLARAAGYWISGYNQVAWLGPLLLMIFLVIYSFLLLRQRPVSFEQLARLCLFAGSLYFLYSTTVHPWYILTLIPFGLLCGLYFPIVWASAAFLSYHAYAGKTVQENGWILALEYGVVIGYICWELGHRQTAVNQNGVVT